jgi:lipoate-protein ligase A
MLVMKAVSFGYSRNSAAKNMALDEALKELSAKTANTYIRFYDFDKDSVILAASDDPGSIRDRRRVEVTRRETGGKTIYVGENTLAYSISGPLDGNAAGSGPEALHRKYSSVALGAISEIVGDAAEVSLGGVYAINVGGMPIAGHAQSIGLGHSFLYHGVVAVGRWNSSRIRESMNFPESDYEKIGMLPALSDFTDESIEADKKLLMDSMLRRVDAKSPADEERREAEELASRLCNEKYRNDEWIEGRGRKLKTGARFCLLYPD